MQTKYLGTMGWSYNFWKDNFYPNKTATKDFLAYYSTKFNTVEVDNTFYRIPNQQTITNWKNQTPEGFKFSLKFPRIITHIKMLKDCERETDLFIERTKALDQKLGPLLLQFPHSFGTEHLADLEDFLHELPKNQRYAVEIRNKNFLNEEFYSLLKVNNVALAWVDSPSMPQHSEITSDFLYVRWEGDRSKVNGAIGKIEADKEADLKIWADKLKTSLSKKLDFYGYFSKYYSGFPPSDINSLLKLLT